jgi:pilus assembly protein CpaF
MIPKNVFEETLLQFLAPVRPYLDDPSVSEIMINGPDQIYVERKGQLEKVPAKFASREALLSALRNLSQYVGKYVDETHPILEGRLPDGSRVEALIPPVAPDGPHVAIRRFFKEALTVERLVQFGSLTGVAAASLQVMVISKLNIMVAGGTGSGKTSMLNALSGFIPDGERVVVIEDSREVQFQKPHVVQLEARPADPKGKGAVSIRDLFRATLRMRPDRVVVGEIRGGEALDIVQAMTSGHGGCMGTLHATHPRDTLTRLETMCMMSDIDMPLAAMRQQIGSGVQLVVQVSRLQDGSRKVTHITEVKGFDTETQRYRVQDIFVREYKGLDANNHVVSELVPTGVLPEFLPQLHEHGLDLPDPVLEVARRAGQIHHAAEGHAHVHR